METNLFKTGKWSKYLLMISVVALMGVVMLRANSKCMTLMSSDETRGDEYNVVSEAGQHSVAPIVEVHSSEGADEVEDAELLYTQMTKFLSKHRGIDPEHFDDVCRDFMNERALPKVNLLSRTDFQDRAKGKIVLYRGIDKRKYADEFKQGKILVSGYNLHNVRGMGIYTTTGFECARIYCDENPDAIIEMFISKDGTKILDYNYLRRLKNIIIAKHSEEFGRLSDEFRIHIFYSYHVYDEKIWAYGRKKVEELGRDASYEEEENFRSEFREKLKREDVVYKKLLEEKRYYETSKEAHLWDNSGLLTKLLGFDALYTQDVTIGVDRYGKSEEYLIVNPNVLYVLAE